jgi:NarL family two-component system response regulator LiaR
MSHAPIRVLVVDDHVIVRQGIRALLTEFEDVEVVGEAGNGLEAVQATESLKPDVVLMDLLMPGMDGVEATRRISEQWPEVRVLVVTTYSGDDLVFPAIKAGARGYALKDAGARELVGAIRQIYRGEPSLHPDIARKLLQEVRQPTPDRRARDPLTAREVEVLRLLAEGLDNQQIAERLVVAEVTVRSHISRILDKLHVANRVQATLYALREGLADLEEGP